MSPSGFFEVDSDELRTRGAGMLGAGDAVHAAAAKGVLLGQGAYGGADLAPASDRFVDRYTYLLNQLGDATIREGHSMRGFAFAYDESDAMVAASLNDIATQLP